MSKSNKAQTKELKNGRKIWNNFGDPSPSGSIRIQGYSTGREKTNVRILHIVSITPGFRLGLKKNLCTMIRVANAWIGVNRTMKMIFLIIFSLAPVIFKSQFEIDCLILRYFNSAGGGFCCSILSLSKSWFRRGGLQVYHCVDNGASFFIYSHLSPVAGQ